MRPFCQMSSVLYPILGMDFLGLYVSARIGFLGKNKVHVDRDDNFFEHPGLFYDSYTMLICGGGTVCGSSLRPMQIIRD